MILYTYDDFIKALSRYEIKMKLYDLKPNHLNHSDSNDILNFIQVLLFMKFVFENNTCKLDNNYLRINSSITSSRYRFTFNDDFQLQHEIRHFIEEIDISELLTVVPFIEYLMYINFDFHNSKNSELLLHASTYARMIACPLSTDSYYDVAKQYSELISINDVLF